MSDIMNDDFVLSDLIHDQIIADGKAPEVRFACRLANVRRRRDSRRNLFDTSNKARGGWGIVLCYVGENLIEIGKRSAFKPELHALR